MNLTTTGRILVLLLLSSLLAPAWAQGADPQARAADLLGIPAADLRDAEIHTVYFRTLDRRVTIVKAVTAGSAEVVGRTLDATTGEDVDFASLRTLEIQARELVPGAKIHSSLSGRLADSFPGETIPIVAWLHYDSATLDAFRAQAFAGFDPLDDAARQAAESAVTAHAMARNADVVGPFANLVEGAGIPVRYVSSTAPAVFLSPTPGQIEVLAGLPEVAILYLEQTRGSDEIIDAHQSHRTYRVHQNGVKGRGVKVAVLENNGVDPACPHLNVSAWYDPGNPDPDDHVHGTSGCIASQLPARIGAAPDAELYSANADSYGDTDVTGAGDWIITQNVDASNMSYGEDFSGVLQYRDHYFDYQARTYADSYLASGGNRGIGDHITSPGVGWNLITAGSFHNNDDGDWSGDAVSGFSSTLDPNTGCEKPNLVAVGNTLHGLGDASLSTPSAACSGFGQPAPWLIDNWCGTSFASPLTAGNLANAMAVSSSLKSYPEAALALMMATAWHNIEGDSRLSEQDGAGGLHGLAAYRAAAAGHVKTGLLTPSGFNNNGYYTYSVWLQGGDRARICLAWFANTDSGYTTTTLDADLDIHIYAGQNATSGFFYGSSTSVANNFEIVEFTPPNTGWYTVRVKKWTFAGAQEHFGIAWSQKYADTACARLREFTSEANTKTGPTIGNQYYYMDWDAPNSPGSAFISYPSGTITGGLPLSASNWSPLDFDIWSELWLDHFTTGYWFWTNPVGTLAASGSFLNHRMALPDVPLIIGWPLHHVGITGDPSSSDGLKELTEVHTFKFWPDPVNLLESDDGSILQNLPFGFKFYGVTYTQCYVNMNGSVSFTAGISDWSESASQMLSDAPRIAGMWDDLGPHQPGTQTGTRVQTRQIYAGLKQELVVEFINVPERTSSDPLTPGTGANTFRIRLHQDDSITLEFRDCDIADCLVGISPGGGISGAAEVDLTSSGRITSGANEALFELFTGSDPCDLAHPSFWFNSLRFVPTSSAATNYRLEVDVE